MSVVAIDLAISTFCAVGFFFSLLGQQQRTPATISVFASLGAFGLTFLTIYAISWALHI
jgi:hypothetical protein